MFTNLTGVPETLLIPLWYRAQESKLPPDKRIISDISAEQLIDQIDYDFSAFNISVSQLVVAIRTRIFQDVIHNFVNKHPTGTVVNLGAGLDNRFVEVDNGSIRWIDLDLPETIELKRKFFQETERRRFVAKSVFNYSWMDDIDVKPEEPVLFVAEGLLFYFKESMVRELLTTLSQRFHRGEIAFELLGYKFAGKANIIREIRSVKGTQIEWSPRDLLAIEKWSPHLRFIERLSIVDRYRERWGYWLLLLWLYPPVRDMLANRIVRLEFVK